jgi:hypothetical protein
VRTKRVQNCADDAQREESHHQKADGREYCDERHQQSIRTRCAAARNTNVQFIRAPEGARFRCDVRRHALETAVILAGRARIPEKLVQLFVALAALKRERGGAHSVHPRIAAALRQRDSKKVPCARWKFYSPTRHRRLDSRLGRMSVWRSFT